jgi:sugar/nucleoside kinase (ribokinase family)
VSGDRIVVVGDVINDVLVMPRGELRRDTDTSSTIRPRPGGSAANTAVWLGSLGASVDLVAAVGTMDADYHTQLFRDHGVTPSLQVELGLPTGTIVIIVEGENRTMLTERGANAALASTSVTDQLLADAALLVVSGYSIFDGFGVPGIRDLIARAGAAGVRVAVTLGSLGYLSDFGAEEFQAAVDGAELAFLNADEGQFLTGESDPDRVARKLSTLFERAVLTVGAEGVIVIERGQTPVRVAAPAARMVDPTGAGDAFAAGFLERWLATGDMVVAAQAGVYVAARAVMVMGGRPPV